MIRGSAIAERSRDALYLGQSSHRNLNKIFWCQKYRVHRLSCGVGCSDVLVEYRLVMDRQTNRRTYCTRIQRRSWVKSCHSNTAVTRSVTACDLEKSLN